MTLAFGFFLRLMAADHAYIGQWDEAYHALVAKNLVAHPLEPRLYEVKAIPADDREWTKAGVWLHKPPLPLWLMAAGIRTFGRGELPFRVPAVLLDTLAILLVFLLARALFDDDSAAVAAALAYAVNPLMIRLVSGTVPDDSVHVINTFFITLSAYLFVKKRPFLAGLSVGLGTLCLSGIALLGFAAPLPLLWKGRAKLAWHHALAGFLLAAVPWPLYAMSRWPELYRHESSLQLNHLLHAVEGHAHAWWWYLKIFPVHYAWAALPAVAALAYAWKRKEARVPLLWLALPYVFFSAIATKLYSYPCAAVPAVCLLLGLGASALLREGPLARGAVALVLIAAVAPRLRADYSIPVWSTVYDYAALRNVALKIGKEPGNKIVLNVKDDKSPQVMFYSGVPAYPDAPTPALMKDLKARGYRVFVLQAEGERVSAPGGLIVPLPAPLVQPAKHPYEA